jgi:hypothetical protein
VPPLPPHITLKHVCISLDPMARPLVRPVRPPDTSTGRQLSPGFRVHWPNRRSRGRHMRCGRMGFERAGARPFLDHDESVRAELRLEAVKTLASTTAPYSIQPSSACTAGTLARNASSTRSHWPGLAVMIATTWIMNADSLRYSISFCAVPATAATFNSELRLRSRALAGANVQVIVDSPRL